MARYLAAIALFTICVDSAVILKRYSHVKDINPVHGLPELLKRNGSIATDGPFKRDFNLSTGKLGTETLVHSDDGLVITCTDCQLEGQFSLEMNFDINSNLLNELATALLAPVSTLEISALSMATSVAIAGVDGVSSIVSQAVPIATSIVHEVSDIAHGIISSAASPITSIAAEATADAASIVSEAAKGIKSAVPFLGNLFDRRGSYNASRNIDTLISEVSRDFNISITQQTPIIANFNLDIRTDDKAIEVDLPTVAFEGFPAFPPSIIQIGIFELQIVFSPLALTSTISMQRNTNVSLSFGADLTLKEPLQITGGSIQATGIEGTSNFSNPVIVGEDPTLCVSAALGPVVKFTLSIPSANVGVDLEAQLAIPELSTCFEKQRNVDEKCQPNGTIADALHVNSTMSIGINSKIAFNLPAHLNVVLPDPPQLPQISAMFPSFDECVDLGGIN